MKKQRIYLDNNATTFLDPQIIESLSFYLHEPIGNPSSTHFFGQKGKALLQECRRKIALSLNVKPQEIVFTSGATEGLNMLIQGCMYSNPKRHIITSSVEHPAVFESIKELEKKGCSVTYLNPGLWGAVTPDQLRTAIKEDTGLIALMAVNNETGVKTDIDSIAEITERLNIPFIVDGVAWAGKEKVKIPSGVFACCFSGHKIHALQGIGVAMIRSYLKWPSLLKGGPQEFGHRGGTENIWGILSIAKAFEILDENLDDSTLQMKNLRDYFEMILLKELEGVSVNGQGPRIGNTSNLAFDGIDGETFLILLDQEGIAASHGSACSSGALEPSRVLLNMGIPLKKVKESVRFSLSRFTTPEEIEQVISTIKKIVTQLRSLP